MKFHALLLSLFVSLPLFAQDSRDSAFLAARDAFRAGDRNYVIGSAGARYTIMLSNRTGRRYEAVATVDGLDVIDGQEADFTKRGYVISPYTSFVIEGWRTSDDTVAASTRLATSPGYPANSHYDAVGSLSFRGSGGRSYPALQTRRRHIEHGVSPPYGLHAPAWG